MQAESIRMAEPQFRINHSIPIPVIKPLGKNDIKKKKKREDLMNSAYGLFTTIGYSHTTILSIAVKAGVGKGTFYNYFKDKEDIRNQLILSRATSLLNNAVAQLQETPELPNMTFSDKIVFITNYIIDAFTEDTDLLKLISKSLTWSLLRDQGKMSEHGSEISLTSFVAEALKNEHVRMKNPDLTIFTLLEMANSTCYSVILNKEPVDIEHFKPYLYRNIKLLTEDALEPED
ncbi:MAG: TetR/AcrR family transcriptional regulator [Eubacteriales bacterium]|nr:TetR/AcrR family transcriptional regulator [Eubacteriales bacterium]